MKLLFRFFFWRRDHGAASFETHSKVRVSFLASHAPFSAFWVALATIAAAVLPSTFWYFRSSSLKLFHKKTTTQDALVLERGSQQSAAQTALRKGPIGGVAGRDGVTVDRKRGARAEGRRVVGALGRRGHNARESPTDEARGRSGVTLGKAAA
jgi:hypothetical protein